MSDEYYNPTDDAVTAALPGTIFWHASDEESGPDVGISVVLNGSDCLFAGEVPRRDGWSIAIYRTDDRIDVASKADPDAARALIEAVAQAISAYGHATPTDNAVTAKAEPTYWAAVAERKGDYERRPTLVLSELQREILERLGGWKITPLYAAPTDDAGEITRLKARIAELEEGYAKLRRERRMIVSHATMGTTDGAGMSVNEIGVRITALRNDLYEDGRARGAKEALGGAA